MYSPDMRRQPVELAGFVQGHDLAFVPSADAGERLVVTIQVAASLLKAAVLATPPRRERPTSNALLAIAEIENVRLWSRCHHPVPQ